MVLKKPKGGKRNYRNLKVRDLVIKGPRSRGQTRDLSSRRRLGGLHNKKNCLKIGLA